MNAKLSKRLAVPLILVVAIGTVIGIKSINSPAPLQIKKVAATQPVKSVTSVDDTTTPTVDTLQPVTTNTTQTQPESTTQPTPPETTAPAPTNPFDKGFSPWYVFNRLQEVGKTMPPLTTNSAMYCGEINLQHYPTSSTPIQYSFGCYEHSYTSAMVFVEKINDDGSIWVSEMNSFGQKSMTDTTPAAGWDVVDYRLIPAASVSWYKFIN